MSISSNNFNLLFFRFNTRVFALATTLIVLPLASLTVNAEWSAGFDMRTYYTDDVALFSVTRRLSLKDDPTQPSVDHPNQGGDFVYEPNAKLKWSGKNSLGDMDITLNAAGYVFADKSAYSHGLYEIELNQTLFSGTQLHVDYNLVPDLFLGKNDFLQTNGSVTEHDERLTNHFWSLYIDQPLSEKLKIRLLGRYGLRTYNEPFQHRDTQFWTIGPHLEWVISSEVELLIGYHYEQGAAKPDRATHFPDDVSYQNHYASAELKLQLLERLHGMFIFDYEKNDFTAANHDDEHQGVAENVYQGEIELLYDLDEVTSVKLGWQHGRRKLNREDQTISNNNLWLGIEYAY